MAVGRLCEGRFGGGASFSTAGARRGRGLAGRVFWCPRGGVLAGWEELFRSALRRSELDAVLVCGCCALAESWAQDFLGSSSRLSAVAFGAGAGGVRQWVVADVPAGPAMEWVFRGRRGLVCSRVRGLRGGAPRGPLAGGTRLVPTACRNVSTKTETASQPARRPPRRRPPMPSASTRSRLPPSWVADGEPDDSKIVFLVLACARDLVAREQILEARQTGEVPHVSHGGVASASPDRAIRSGQLFCDSCRS